MSTQSTPGWPGGWIEGVGQVPSGPRVVQIASSSVAVVPGMASSARLPSSDFVIKTEPTDETFLRSVEEAEQPAVNELPDEERLGPADLLGAQELEALNANDFAYQFNMYNQQSRNSRNRSSYYSRESEGDTAVRQSIDTSVRLRSRGRSRNPLRIMSTPLLTSTSPERSTMFFSEERTKREPRSSESESGPLTSNSIPSPAGTPEPKIKEEENDEDSRCRCSISLTCPHRRVNYLDCRSLVLDWKAWDYRKDQEAYDEHRIAASYGERFTDVATLISIVGVLDQFETATTAQLRRTMVGRMKIWIYKMEDVTITPGAQQAAATAQVLPRFHTFLDPQNYQQRRNKSLSMFVEEELTVLDIKWIRGDFDGSIHRGLIHVTERNNNRHRVRGRFQVDVTWPFYKSGSVFGNNGLVNGQIFMSREELRRDGVHAPPIAGISGTIKAGAYSVVLGKFDEKKNEGYADIDLGNVIEYVGTALRDEEGLGATNEADPHMHIQGAWDQSATAAKPTACTQAMMRSIETGKPVRVIRSWQMCGIVGNRPVKGYRYDGLYKVIGKTALKERRQIWSFRLKRLGDQGPLRGFRVSEPPRNATGRCRGHFYT